MISKYRLLPIVLFCAFFFSCFARGINSLRVAPNFSSVLWDESIYDVFASSFAANRSEFINSVGLQNNIIFAGILVSAALIIVALGSLFIFIKTDFFRTTFIFKFKKTQFILCCVGFMSIFGIAFLKFVGRGYQLPQLVEWGIQYLSPFIFYLYFTGRELRAFKLGIVATAMTFGGHGVYALGFGVGVPSYFLDMTIAFFGLSELFAANFLRLAGVLDLLIVLGCFYFLVFGYNRREHRVAFWLSYFVLCWAVLWGAITALARVFIIPSFTLDLSLVYWFFETLVRFPHALIPLFLVLTIRKKHTLEPAASVTEL